MYVFLDRFRHEFGERQADGQQWFSYKLHWSDQRKSVLLVAGPTGLEQKDPGSNKLLATYYYRDLDGIAEVQLNFKTVAVWFSDVEFAYQFGPMQ